jgi:hypothetical protein
MLRRGRDALVRILGICIGLAPLAVRADCSQIDPSHAAWTAVLREHVRDGRVDYSALKRNDVALEAYLTALSGTCKADYAQWSDSERIAFWIDAYNAFTIRLILDHYPIASIRRIGWLPGAAFRERFIPLPGLVGETVSLDTIEHGTLRVEFREPRIHFALVCAAMSCPRLRSEAYRGADLDRQLDEEARRFLADARVNRVDAAARKLHLSPIFDWFREDFERDAGSLQSFVARYLPAGTGSVADYAIEFETYDWSLNDQRASN